MEKDNRNVLMVQRQNLDSMSVQKMKRNAQQGLEDHRTIFPFKLVLVEPDVFVQEEGSIVSLISEGVKDMEIWNVATNATDTPEHRTIRNLIAPGGPRIETRTMGLESLTLEPDVLEMSTLEALIAGEQPFLETVLLGLENDTYTLIGLGYGFV